MITATMRIPASGGLREQILQALKPLVGPTRVLPGCISCRLYQEVDEASSILMLQQWASMESLESHIRSERYRRLLEIVETANSTPEIRFDTAIRSQGLELVEGIRLRHEEHSQEGDRDDDA